MAAKRKTHREAEDMGAMLARLLRAMVRRAADGDLMALRELAKLRPLLDQAMVDAAAGAHGDPHHFSWSEIGAELGMSRQAVQQLVARGQR